jgi:serine-type D-Ala-D-Ala carboxypeptidase/endopeptidase (penicillin-binding protein 4)
MTPRSIVKLWEKIYATISRERLFPLLVTNGQNGTLRTVGASRQPYIFGKTGSLNNNYCLSGYIVTKKNRVLIFSSMNANFIGPNKPIRDNLETILNYVYEKY